MQLDRQQLLGSLPQTADGVGVRHCTFADFERLAAWPPYPDGFHAYNLGFAELPACERQEQYRRRESPTDRINLVGDAECGRAVIYLCLVHIDWPAGFVGNMGYRVHPHCCDRGLGSRFMRIVGDWLLCSGFVRLRLDVAAPNVRARRCYEKAGFTVTGEFWRPDRRLALSHGAATLNGNPHVRHDGEEPRVRFWWMERC